ncbi:MAG: SpoIIE family protein phosphatase [Mariprofundaceae bacterium]
MNSEQLTGMVNKLSICRFLLQLWPLLPIFATSQLIMRFSGNSDILGLPMWFSLLNLFVFVIAYIGIGTWVHWPLNRWKKRVIRTQTTHSGLLEIIMADLPWRALKGFGLSGIVCATWLTIGIAIVASISSVDISIRMFIALIISYYFGGVILATALAVSASIAYAVKLRSYFSNFEMFIGGLGSSRFARSFTSASRRPWVIYLVTGLIPTILLAIYAFLALGAEGLIERSFIVAQALVLLVATVLAGGYLVYSVSRQLKLITQELLIGLEHLHLGRFDKHVPVLMDDDLGELARGLNTALTGLKEREDIKDSLKIATEIQYGLLPQQAPAIPHYALYGFQQSCHAVGGDYYDHIILPDGRIWLLIADVAGKGYPAALTVANLQAMLHALASKSVPFEEAAAYVNNTLCKTLTGGRFVTLFMAKLQPDNHSLLWLNAGHLPPMLLHKNKISTLKASAPPMGLVADTQYEVVRSRLDRDDLLIAYTDGVTEARGRFDHEMFGEARLQQWMYDNSEEQLERLPGSLLQCLGDFGNSVREDDLTLLFLKRET